MKYLASMSFRQFSQKRFPKQTFDREASKKYFARVFEIYDSIIDVGYKQKRSFKGNIKLNESRENK